MAYLPSIFRGNNAMPLFRAAAPVRGDIRKDMKSVVSSNSDLIGLAVVGGVRCEECLSPACVEFHEAGILDAVRLGFGDGKDHPLADVRIGLEDHFDIVAIRS